MILFSTSNIYCIVLLTKGSEKKSVISFPLNLMQMIHLILYKFILPFINTCWFILHVNFYIQHCHHIPLGSYFFSSPTSWFCTSSSSNFWTLFLGEEADVSRTFPLQVLFSALLDIQHLKKGTVHWKVESFTMPAAESYVQNLCWKFCIPFHDFFSTFPHDQLILKSALKSRDLKESVHLYIQYKAGT